MPCYTVVMQPIELKMTNKDLIIEVLTEMRLRPQEVSNGVINTNIGQFDLNKSKIMVASYNIPAFNQFQQNYSKKILKVAASKWKFIVKQDVNDQNHFVVNKW